MGAVLVVQMPRDKVIDVAAVRNGLVPARRTVLVLTMPLAGVPAVATLWILTGDSKDVFVDMSVMDIMQVAVVKIVDVIFVTNGRVSARGRMRMCVLIVGDVLCHATAHWRLGMAHPVDPSIA